MYVDINGRQMPVSSPPINWIGGGKILYGDQRNNGFYGAGNSMLIGGLGNDTYMVWVTTTQIIEEADGGIDTLDSRIWGVAILPPGVENLILSGGGSTGGIGNQLANILVAGIVGATLDGLGGDDVLVAGPGADIIRVQAGNGSDAIENFTPGSDVVQLLSYGIDGFDAVMRVAAQIGDDVTLSLDNGEHLVLRNVDLHDLDAYDFGFTKPLPDLLLGQRSLSGPGKAHTYLGWYVLNNVWNPGTLVYKTDYQIDNFFDPLDLTSGVTFVWSFPLKTEAYPTIIAYPEVIFGPAPMGSGGKPTDIGGMFPLQVGMIDELTADYDVSYEGNTGGFNVAFDIWLTDKPNGGPDSITNEIMVWIHRGDIVPNGNIIGEYKYGDFSARIYSSGGGDWTYTAVVIDEEYPHGTISIASIVLSLQDLGIVSPSEYLASIELGAEIAAGAGRLTINDLMLTAKLDDRIIVATGSGTEVLQLHVSGGAGDDHIVYNPLQNLIDGGAGTDTLVLRQTAKVMLDRQAASQVEGNTYVQNFENVDASAAPAGVTLVGSNKTNTLMGSAFADRIDAGGGNDTVKGGAGNDIIDGGEGRDRIYGEAGNDTLVYNANDYLIDGGAGTDTLVLMQAAEVRLDRHAASQVDGSAYVRYFENVDASASTGDVTLIGSNDANVLTGSAFADVLTGGGGADRFVFTSTPTSSNPDVITDFAPSEDRIHLNGAAFGLASGSLQAGVLTTGTAAKDSNDWLIYDGVTGFLYFDADGSGNMQAPIAFAVLESKLAIKASSFWIL